MMREYKFQIGDAVLYRGTNALITHRYMINTGRDSECVVYGITGQLDLVPEHALTLSTDDQQ